MCKKQKLEFEDFFKKTAKAVYDNKAKGDESKVKSFDELQQKLTKLTSSVCEDQYFGILKIEKSNPPFCEWVISPNVFEKKKPSEEDKEKLFNLRKDFQKDKSLKDKNLKTIVIVLESPHIDEFFTKNEAIGPACGTTGDNLRKMLPGVLLNYRPCIVDKNTYKAEYNSCKDIKCGIYRIKLVNAIQYQCSLGEDTENYRDIVFSQMWENPEIKQSFKERLENTKPDIIINCCTKGNVKVKEEELRYLVQQEINNCNKEKKYLLLRAAHPSSICFKNGLSWVDENEF